MAIYHGVCANVWFNPYEFVGSGTGWLIAPAPTNSVYNQSTPNLPGLRGGVLQKNKRVDLIEAWESAWPRFESTLRPVGARVGTARFGSCRNGCVFLRPADNEDRKAHV